MTKDAVSGSPGGYTVAFQGTKEGDWDEVGEWGATHDMWWPVHFQWPSIQPPSRRMKWGGFIPFFFTNLTHNRNIDFFSKLNIYFLSKMYVSNLRAPQGTVLSPFLFTPHTLDFRYNTMNCLLQKFSARGKQSGAEEGHHRLRYLVWTQPPAISNRKRKKMVFDFRRKPPTITPVNIHGLDIDIGNGELRSFGVCRTLLLKLVHSGQ